MEYIDMKGIANLKVYGLPATVRGLNKLAEREQWQSRKRQGRGGGLEYAVSSLPAAVQEAIRAKESAKLLANVPALPTTAAIQQKPNRKMQQLGLIPTDDALSALNDRQMQVANARCALVGYVLTLYESEQLGLGLKEAVQYVVEQVQTGKLPEDKMHFVQVANDRHGKKQQGLSFPTLYRWVRAFRSASSRNERLAVLAPKKTKEKTAPEQLGWLNDFLGYYLNSNKPTIVAAMKRMAVDYTARGKIMPSYDQVQNVVKKLPPYVKNRGRETGSAYRQRLPYVRRDWSVLNPNDVWVGDGHSFKAKIQHPITGQPAVLEFTMIVDGCTSAIMGWSVSLAENTLAVADALRHGMQHYGIPLIYYSDNGAGQTAKLLDHDLTGILPRLGVEHATGIPGNPQGRARIERLWKNTAIELAKTYPTYQGKDADRETVRKTSNALQSAYKAEAAGKELSPQQAAAKRKLPTFKQFVADLEKMVWEYNETHEHRSLPKDLATGRHYTPMAYYRERIARDKVEIEAISPLELEFMFRPEVRRKVSARAEIQFLNNVYFDMKLLDFAGQEVRVGFDIHDAGSVLVKQIDGTPICKAVCDGNKRDAFPQAYVDKVREERKKRKVKKAEQTIALAEAEAKPAIPHNPAYELLDKLPQQPKQQPAKIVDFDWEYQQQAA